MFRFRQIIPCSSASDGVDLRQPLTREEAAAIDAGMDRYAVLVFHDQDHHRRPADRVHEELREIEGTIRRQYHQAA